MQPTLPDRRLGVVGAEPGCRGSAGRAREQGADFLVGRLPDPIMDLHVRLVASAQDWAIARSLVETYAASLGIDLSFQHFDEELARLPTIYGPPSGVFLFAEASEVVGCVGLRPAEPPQHEGQRTAEIKRLFVHPSFRGRGVGRRLLERVLDEATAFGYQRVVLDTLPSMVEAKTLYEAAGFEPIAPYRVNPVPGAAYYGRALGRKRSEP